MAHVKDKLEVETPQPVTSVFGDGHDCPMQQPIVLPSGVEELRAALEREIGARRRAECMARLQSNSVQLSLDLLMSESDVDGFFRVFMRTLIDECDAHACGVFLLDDEGAECEMWMAYVGEKLYARDQPDWDSLQLPRENMGEHLISYRQGWTELVEYAGDDPRLPQSVRELNRSIGLQWVTVAPLLLSHHNLGWIALSTGDAPPDYAPWRRALLEAVARQATLALQQSRLAEHSRNEARHQAVLEERNRIARDIHDTLAQGFAAILMQLQSTQRANEKLPRNVSRAIDTAVDLARTNMLEARRSVCALRPSMEGGDFTMLLERSVELARRVTDVPIDLTIEDLPVFGANVESELASIVQEALTNAVRHARAKRITVNASSARGVGFRLSVADDGKGIAKERFGTGFGLTSMQERAERIGASLTIVTAPRSGTEIVLAWDPPQFTIPSHANH